VSALDTRHANELLQRMILVRRFEEKCAEMYGLGKIRGFLHLYVGEEASGVGAMAGLDDDDNVVATYREHGQALLRGVSSASVMSEMFGKADGCSRGRGGSMHLFNAQRRFFGGHAIVGAGLPVAVGLALADKLQRKRRVTAIFFGEGASEEGEFHESLNLASVWKVPVLFLCENNLYAMGTKLERHMADTDLLLRPAAYGIPAESVDAMDVVAVERAVRYAADVVRESGTPRFLELKTYRFRAHSMYDAEKYRDKAEVVKWQERDPIELFVARMMQAGIYDPAARARIEAEVKAELDAAVAHADAAPLEPVEDLERDVFTEAPR